VGKGVNDMASAVSYEFLKALKGAPGGLATLNDDGKVPDYQLPNFDPLFVGTFADEGALTAAFPVSSIAHFAFVTDTATFWYWNPRIPTGTPDNPTFGAWVNQEINEADYLSLTADEKSMVPYLVVPN
jgi:hypothetical protein